MRRTATLTSLLATGLLVGLAACTPSGEEPDAPENPEVAAECTPSGDASDAITIEGDFGSLPEISFESPLEVAETQRTVISEGDGELVNEGDIVVIDYTILNGATADEIETTGFSEDTTVELRVDSASPLLGGLSKVIACSPEGTRVVGVIPPVDAFGETGAPEFGVTAEQPLVFVADVVALADPPLARAEGEAQPAPEGFPAVELDDSGAPTITIPDTEPPADYGLEVLIQGDGETVGDGATVTVHYTGINWTTGEVFDSSWDRGQPAQFPTGGVIPGFRDALVGQQVGSQVIAIIPPELGYGPQGGTPDGSIGAEDTIVFVVDILATNG